MFEVELRVLPKPGVKDPQAEAVGGALADLGYFGTHVEAVGRLLRLRLECGTEARARELVADMCERLLVNPNLEVSEVSLKAVARGDGKGIQACSAPRSQGAA